MDTKDNNNSEKSVNEASAQKDAKAQGGSEDEISIDFSTIKSWFSSKSDKKEAPSADTASSEPKEEKATKDAEEKNEAAKEDAQETPSKKEESKETASNEKKQEAEKPDDEIVIDFSKITSFFKGEDKEEAVVQHAEQKIESNKKGAKKTEEKEESDDDISIDFSGIKAKMSSVFSGEDTQSKEKSDDDITIDWGKVGHFFKTYGIFVLMLIPILLSTHVRLTNADLPITDGWAEDSIINSIRDNVANQVSSQYPNLPAQTLNELVNAETQKVLTDNWPQIQQQITANSNAIKQHFMDPQGIPYMPDIDTYYWMRYAENILANGHPGDILKDGRPYDTFQLAPNGRYVFSDMLAPYFLAYFHKFLTLFSPSMTIVETMSWYPVLFAAICTFLVFLLARKISNPIGALFAATIFAVNTSFLGRSLYGHADNDGFVMLFPLLITYLFFEMLNKEKLWQAIVLGSLGGVCITLYSFGWAGGWWFIFDMIIGMAAVALLFVIAKDFDDLKKLKLAFFKRKEALHLIAGTLCFVVISALGVTLVMGSSQIFLNGVLGPLSFVNIKAPVTPSLWPNVLTTVAELNPGDRNAAVGSVGGKIYFWIALIGISLAMFASRELKSFDVYYIVLTALFYGTLFIPMQGTLLYNVLSLPLFVFWIFFPLVFRIGLSIVRKRKDISAYEVKVALLLALWVVGTVYATVKGIRFTLLLAPAFSVAFGVAIGTMHRLFSEWFTKELKVHKAISSIMLILLFSLLLISPIRSAYGAAENDLPIVNDVWYNSLMFIKSNSSEDAIITSWWDFGHHFKQIADRPVTFDGTTQTFPPSRWTGKMLSTSNEEEAIGILRMLDCSGGYEAVNLIDEKIQHFPKSINLIDSLLPLSASDAQKKLRKEGFSEEQSKAIVALTHCTPREGYLISSNDMIGKSGVWGHFGAWNFERADIWYNVRPMEQQQGVDYLMQKYNYTKEKAESVVYEVKAIPSDEEGNRWVASWPGYSNMPTCRRDNSHSTPIFVCDEVVFDGNVRVNLIYNYTAKSAYGVVSGSQSRLIPSAISYPTQNGFVSKTMDGSNFGLGITFIPEDKDTFLAVLSSQELVGGLFTITYFAQGHGLKYFDRVYSERGIIGTDVQVYKADWEGTTPTIVEQYVNALDEIDGKIKPAPSSETLSSSTVSS